MTNEHTSLEKYTSHTLFEMLAKGLRKGYVQKVSWRLNRDCNILTPSSSVFCSTSFSFCWAARPGALKAQPSAESWFSLPRTGTTDSKLTELPVAPGYIIVWLPPASCGCPICTQFTVKVIPYPYLPNPCDRAGYDTRSVFKRSLTGLNSEFSFSSTSCFTKAEEPSLSYYLPIAGGWIIGFIPFPRVLVLCERQSVSSRIWTRVAVSISYDDNHYTTGTSTKVIPYLRSDTPVPWLTAGSKVNMLYVCKEIIDMK